MRSTPPRTKHPLLTTVRRWAADEHGSTTIETALGFSSLVLIFSLLLAGLMAVATYISAIDTAGAAARAAAIGEPYTPSRGEVIIEENGAKITATATIPSFFGAMSAHAVFVNEQSLTQP